MWSFRDPEVACLIAYHQGYNVESLSLENSSCDYHFTITWGYLAQFSLYVHTSRLKSHLYIRSFFGCSFVCSFVRSSVVVFIHSFIHPSIHLLIHHVQSFIYSFVDSFIKTIMFIHKFIMFNYSSMQVEIIETMFCLDWRLLIINNC